MEEANTLSMDFKEETLPVGTKFRFTRLNAKTIVIFGF